MTIEQYLRDEGKKGNNFELTIFTVDNHVTITIHPISRDGETFDALVIDEKVIELKDLRDIVYL